MDVPEPPATTRTPSILLDSAVLLGLRGVYFLLSRRYLLASLSPTLRGLQRPDNVLPTATRDRSNSTAGSSRGGAHTPDTSAVPLLSDIDEDEDTPLSSYPPSPGVAHPRQGSSSSSDPIELNLINAKLRDTSPRVVEVSHSHVPATVTTTKRAARELSRAARVLFSLCFAESLNLITVVIFHAIGILHAHSRQVNFSASLHIILALVLLVVPLMQCMLFTYRSKESTSVSTRKSSLPLRSRVLIALVPYALYIFLFTRIPPYITAVQPATPILDTPDGQNGTLPIGQNGTLPIGNGTTPGDWTSGPEGWESGGWLAPSLGRVVVLGVLVIAGLSGIGAVVTAWDYLEEAAGAKRPVTDGDILQAERSLYRVRHDIVQKREEIMRIGPSETSGWMGRVFGTKADQEAAALQAEMGGLELMEEDIARSLAAMKKRRRSQGFKHTVRGSVYNILGYVFAIYCAARLLMCLVSLFTAPKTTGTTNGDWISWVLALALAHTGGDVAAWSRAISLLLTGLLVVSSLAMVLRWLGRVLRLTSRTVGAGFLLLFLGQLFATYTISLLVQLRTSLPPPEPGTTVQDHSLLRTLPDFRVFGRLFDAVFLLAATATAAYRYIAMKVSNDGDMYASLGRS